jgi:hypothetical protein
MHTPLGGSAFVSRDAHDYRPHQLPKLCSISLQPSSRTMPSEVYRVQSPIRYIKNAKTATKVRVVKGNLPGPADAGGGCSAL